MRLDYRICYRHVYYQCLTQPVLRIRIGIGVPGLLLQLFVLYPYSTVDIKLRYHLNVLIQLTIYWHTDQGWHGQTRLYLLRLKLVIPEVVTS